MDEPTDKETGTDRIGFREIIVWCITEGNVSIKDIDDFLKKVSMPRILSIIKGRSVIEMIRSKDIDSPKVDSGYVSSKNMTREEAENFKNRLKCTWG